MGLVYSFLYRVNSGTVGEKHVVSSWCNLRGVKKIQHPRQWKNKQEVQALVTKVLSTFNPDG